MSDKNIGQSVQCDSCIWEGYEAELEQATENKNVFDTCPACGDPSISYMGHEVVG